MAAGDRGKIRVAELVPLASTFAGGIALGGGVKVAMSRLMGAVNVPLILGTGADADAADGGIVLDHSDFSATDVTETLQLWTPTNGEALVLFAWFRLLEQFAGPSLSEVLLELGWDGADADDNGLVTTTGQNLFSDTVGVQYGVGPTERGALYSDSPAKVPYIAGSLTATLSTTGCNIDDLTAGQVLIGVLAVDLAFG